MFLIKRPFFRRYSIRKGATLWQNQQKRRSVCEKARCAVKLDRRRRLVKRPVSKKTRGPTKTGKGGPSKSRKETTESPAVLLGMNHREKRLDPFTRAAKRKTPSASRRHGRFHGRRCPGHSALPGRRQRGFRFWNASGRRRSRTLTIAISP